MCSLVTVNHGCGLIPETPFWSDAAEGRPLCAEMALLLYRKAPVTQERPKLLRNNLEENQVTEQMFHKRRNMKTVSPLEGLLEACRIRGICFDDSESWTHFVARTHVVGLF